MRDPETIKHSRFHFKTILFFLQKLSSGVQYGDFQYEIRNSDTNNNPGCIFQAKEPTCSFHKNRLVDRFIAEKVPFLP